MFDSRVLEHKLDKRTFKALEPRLREDLLNAQFEFADQKARTILVLVNGADGAGKGEVVNRLYEWLDVHMLETMSYEADALLDRSHPLIWPYWRDLPARGRIGIVLGSWYHVGLLARATGRMSSSEFSDLLTHINRFEAMLHAEGVVLLKLWLALDPADARRRFVEKGAGDRFDRPRIREWGEIDTKKELKRLTRAAFEVAEATSPGHAPWFMVPAGDGRYRDAAIGTKLLEVLRRETQADTRAAEAPAALALPAGTSPQVIPIKAKAGAPQAVPQAASQAAPQAAPKAVPKSVPLPASLTAATQATDIVLPKVSILSAVDYSKAASDDEYDAKLPELQERIYSLASSRAFRDRGLICVFEGNDAAGKGGCILRLRQALDPREFRVHTVAAPTDEERAHPYLWRFWRHVPQVGRTAIFDRSWYGRVLVERVEGFCSEADWMRAYDEINEFERSLDTSGYMVVKFWLAITPDEQLKRFKARMSVPFKRFKITPDDWRNREKWPLYETAVTDMVDRTSTPRAPWHLIPAENKRYSRLKVLKTVADRLKAEL